LRIGEVFLILVLITVTYLVCRIIVWSYYASCGNRTKKLILLKIKSGWYGRITGLYLLDAKKGQNFLIRLFLFLANFLLLLFLAVIILPFIIPASSADLLRSIFRIFAWYLYLLFAYIVVLGIYIRIKSIK
jgi:hypothetical protein